MSDEERTALPLPGKKAPRKPRKARRPGRKAVSVIEAAGLSTRKKLSELERMALQKEDERLKDVENDILKKSLDIVESSLAYADIDRDAKEPPAAWVSELGVEAAMKKFRIAQSSWLALKDSPVALKMATAMASSIIRSRSTEKLAPRALSITWISADGKAPQQLLDRYPEVVVNANKDEE